MKPEDMIADWLGEVLDTGQPEMVRQKAANAIYFACQEFLRQKRIAESEVKRLLRVERLAGAALGEIGRETTPAGEYALKRLREIYPATKAQPAPKSRRPHLVAIEGGKKSKAAGG